MTVVCVEAKNCRTTSDASVNRSVVMMQDPGVVVPLVWRFAPDFFSLFNSPSVLVEQIPYARCLQ